MRTWVGQWQKNMRFWDTTFLDETIYHISRQIQNCVLKATLCVHAQQTQGLDMDHNYPGFPDVHMTNDKPSEISSFLM